MIILPDLPYPYGALAPAMSEATLRTHHGRHHRAYVEAVNALTRGEAGARLPLESLIRDAAQAREPRLFNNAAQAWNHAFLWNCMAPDARPPAGRLADAIAASFGGLPELREAFLDKAGRHFGSGWAWLALDRGRLTLFTTHDAETAATRELVPLLVCDLWEHAWYLDHRSDRAGYLAAWWDRLANWAFAEAQFTAAADGRPAWRYPSAEDAPPARHPLEDALEEAFALLDARPAPGSAEDRRLVQLIESLARVSERTAAAAEARSMRPDLDRRIREAAARLSRAGQDHPWSPLTGGDLGVHGGPAE